MKELIIKHYNSDYVKREIFEFSVGRWLALEGEPKDEKRIFIRYLGRAPLKLIHLDDVPKLIRRFRGISPRTIYATINVYRRLYSESDTEDLNNISYVTPFIDIDTELDKWEYAIHAAKVIIEFLENEGINRSLYVLWSGEGAHVRIHERAFSLEIIQKYHPLDIAFAIIEYTLSQVKEKLNKLIKDSGGVLKIENLVDAKRVFTVPLSFHRSRDLIAVCLKPNDLDSFHISWADPFNYRHNPDWRSYEPGEADNLALKALKRIGQVKTSITANIKSTRIAKTAENERMEDKSSISAGKVGRFQVMALLQAARYYLLTGDLAKAKSFGLNRAIFYAWAKHYGRFYASKKIPIKRFSSSAPVSKKDLKTVFGEEIYVSPRGFFVMGDREQLPEDYDKHVASKIESVVLYEKAWKAALDYLSRFPKSLLINPRKFYEKAYKPVRDTFFEKEILSKKEVRGTKGLLDWVKKGKE